MVTTAPLTTSVTRTDQGWRAKTSRVTNVSIPARVVSTTTATADIGANTETSTNTKRNTALAIATDTSPTFAVGAGKARPTICHPEGLQARRSCVFQRGIRGRNLAWA